MNRRKRCGVVGKNDKRDPRRTLVSHFFRTVNIICPKFFVMENVERIKKSQILSDVVKQYTDAGYGVTTIILDASYCNVPQARKRFFLIGSLDIKH
ncbi:MAG: hypothetical protein COA73_17505, partial [Candidatus Hydrogenedentota bacterium]